MSLSEEYAEKIADYLEDKMDPGQEEAFMRELDNNEALRNQFEQELVIRSLLQDAGETPFMGIETEDGTLLQPQPQEKARVLPFLSRYRIAAAAVLIILVGGTVFYLVERQSAAPPIGPGSRQVAGDTPHSKESPEHGPPKERLLAQTTADSLYNEFYRPYSGSNTPAGIARSPYQRLYQQGDYRAVIVAYDTTLASEGGSDTLGNFITLYKGLSYLALGETENAAARLDSVLRQADEKSTPFLEAQWYSALAALRKNELEKTVSLLKDITKTPSPYYSKADQLLTKLRAR